MEFVLNVMVVIWPEEHLSIWVKLLVLLRLNPLESREHSLTMRTFHIGGAAQLAVEQSSIEASVEGTIVIKNRSVVKNSKGENIVMSRYSEVCIMDAAHQERARYKLPYGARLLVDDGAHVKPGDKLSRLGSIYPPIISEVSGIVHYVDLVEGLSMRESRG